MDKVKPNSEPETLDAPSNFGGRRPSTLFVPYVTVGREGNVWERREGLEGVVIERYQRVCQCEATASGPSLCVESPTEFRMVRLSCDECGEPWTNE